MPDYTLADMASPGKEGSATGDRKKTFDFRMSKKVAELTQVVHMLFTRNHEKEVEIEALRDAYEHEIGLVLKSARAKITELEQQLRHLQQSRMGDNGELRASLEKEFSRKEAAWQERLVTLETQLASERKECAGARDLLIQARADLETLRQGHADELRKSHQELDSETKEVKRLQQTLACLEKRLKESDTSVSNSLQSMRRENEKLQRDLAVTTENLSVSEKLREQAVGRSKQLEGEVRMLKKELQRKSDRSDNKSGRSSAGSRPESKDNGLYLEYSEEVDRLRKEVARLRNELSNREENFNRMFTQQHPVVLDKRAGKLAFSLPGDAVVRYSSGGRENTMPVNASYPAAYSGGLVVGRPAGGGPGTGAGVTLSSQASNSRPTSGLEDRDLMSPVPNLTVTVSNANVFFTPPQNQGSKCDNSKALQGSPRQTIHARLPHLGLDQRRSPGGAAGRLAKPRPLPRELLSAKAGTHA